MIAGGIEKALISMIESMPREEYEINLFVMGRGGEFEQYIPKHVKVKCLYGEEISTVDKIKNYIKRFSFINAAKVGIYSAIAMKAKLGYDQEKYLAKILPRHEEIYDIAIAYHVPASFPVVYVVEYLNAKRKVAWIHSDIEIYKEEMKRYQEYYNNFDKIYCVSKDGEDKFKKQYPHLKSKTDVFYNIVNREQIYLLADKEIGFKDDFDGIRILTVGRLTEEKGYDIVPPILAELINKGYKVKWYCIGDGKTRDNIENLMKKYDLGDKLILLGTKLNPYPYFKECDIYVQPSRHEGYCITLAEARIFNKPIVTTDFIGALEQINDNTDGLIVKFNQDDILNGIIKIIRDDKLKIKFISNLENQHVDNNSIAIEKLLINI